MAAVSDSSITGYTTYACRPASTCFRTNYHTCSIWSAFICLVRIGFLPGGISSIIETSRSP